jgi:hypothetical protein
VFAARLGASKWHAGGTTQWCNGEQRGLFQPCGYLLRLYFAPSTTNDLIVVPLLLLASLPPFPVYTSPIQSPRLSGLHGQSSHSQGPRPPSQFPSKCPSCPVDPNNLIIHHRLLTVVCPAHAAVPYSLSCQTLPFPHQTFYTRVKKKKSPRITIS